MENHTAELERLAEFLADFRAEDLPA